jgi:hypothetical protein
VIIRQSYYKSQPKIRRCSPHMSRSQPPRHTSNSNYGEFAAIKPTAQKHTPVSEAAPASTKQTSNHDPSIRAAQQPPGPPQPMAYLPNHPILPSPAEKNPQNSSATRQNHVFSRLSVVGPLFALFTVAFNRILDFSNGLDFYLGFFFL